MAKKKKLGLRFDLNEKRETVMVRVTYNGTNTKLITPLLELNTYEKRYFWNNPKAHFDKLVKNDTLVFKTIQKVYEDYGYQYEATDFTYRCKPFTFLCKPADLLFEEFLAQDLYKFLSKENLPYTAKILVSDYENVVTLPLDQDFHLRMIKELNPSLFDSIVDHISRYTDTIRFLRKMTNKKSYFYFFVAEVLALNLSDRPNGWSPFRDYCENLFMELPLKTKEDREFEERIGRKRG
ncbi:MAG: hypothetical protein RIA69_08845 [Cyclobacteriaceae bacterium]